MRLAEQKNDATRAPRPRTTPAWSIALLCAVLALACPPYFDDYQPTSAQVPADAESANVELTARVPQGDWALHLAVSGRSELESAEPSARIQEHGCTGADCELRQYELHCPRGMCSFTFRLAAMRPAFGSLDVSAGFVFEGDPGDHGCGDRPNPNYVAAEDRERLFELSWNVSDVVHGMFAELDGSPPSIGPADAEPLDSGADAHGEEHDAAAPPEAGPPLEPVQVIRGDPAQPEWWDLSVHGADLHPYEGMIVTVRVGDPEAAPERLGSGRARVENGIFALPFPEVWEAGLYKQKRAFIDVDRNGLCDPTIDAVFSDARGAQVAVLTIRPDAASAPEIFPPSRSRTTDCQALNANWPAE